jgi:glycosyltransferase involved in cell wall biosynthesis
VAGQCQRSGGGLVYADDREFAAAVDRARSPERSRLGEAGRAFVARDCSWERVLAVYRRAVARVAGAGS